MKLSDWQAEGIKLFGQDPNQWQFVCPGCGLDQTPQDFLDLGLHQRQVDRIASYSCIRRWTDQVCMVAGDGPIKVVIAPHEIRNTFEWKTSHSTTR